MVTGSDRCEEEYHVRTDDHIKVTRPETRKYARTSDDPASLRADYPGTSQTSRVKPPKRYCTPSSLFLVPCPLFLCLTSQCDSQQRQGDASKKHPPPPLPPRKTRTTRGPSPSFPRPPAPRPGPRKTIMPAATNYDATRVSGSTLTMTCRRWSTRKVASSSRKTGRQTMI